MSARLEHLTAQQQATTAKPAFSLQGLIDGLRERQLARQGWKHQGHGLSSRERAKLDAWRSHTRAPQLG